MDTAKGMLYLHANKPPIMHRDLKTPNLLVDYDWNVKLIDFGFTKVKDAEYTRTKLGTPQWMAPEILKSQPYNEKVDVYAFGMCVCPI